MSPLVSAPFDWIWTCDISLEPPWLPYEQSMGENRFACAARPQCAKMCFLLYKLPPNCRLEPWIIKISYLTRQNRFTHEQKSRFARAARPQCMKLCFLLHKLASNGRFEASINIINYPT